MYPLNLTIFKRSISLLVCLIMSACSSTGQISMNTIDNDNQEYVGTNFSHSQFNPISQFSIKKPLNTDHELMMSLLNRPMTADQAMMLAFAQERADYANTFANYVDNGVMIKGDKASENNGHRAVHVYAQQINHDINAVIISAP